MSDSIPGKHITCEADSLVTKEQFTILFFTK